MSIRPVPFLTLLPPAKELSDHVSPAPHQRPVALIGRGAACLRSCEHDVWARCTRRQRLVDWYAPSRLAAPPELLRGEARPFGQRRELRPGDILLHLVAGRRA